MKLRQYENKYYQGIRFFITEKKELFAVMGSNKALHESGLLPEEDYQKLLRKNHLPFGVIFSEDKAHLFGVHNLTEVKILVEQLDGSPLFPFLNGEGLLFLFLLVSLIDIFIVISELSK